MLTPRARWLALPVLLALTGHVVRADLPRVPTDFEVRVVASVPTVLFPSQIATAPDGSLFVAEDSMDQPGPHEANNGRILLFREGKEPVVFASGLRAVFGMAWRDGELYVSHMPFLSVFRDADGDGRAELRRDLFKDLGITNNQGLNDHIVSGIQFGIDGKLYISTGDKGVLKATGPDGKTAQLKGGGTLRCRPDGTEIEVLTTGTRNHLEPNLDEQDNLFTYDNTDDGDGWWTRVTHHVDGGYYGYPYDYHKHPDRFLNRISEYGGGSPCGGVVYREDVWPEQYRGRVFWAEWGKRKVQGFRFEPDGASFRIKDIEDLVQPGKDSNFVPIDLAISYDGRTMYVADWGMGGWNSPTEKVGAIYAITYKGPAIATRPRGQDSDPLDAQFRQLDHPSYNERMRAQSAIIRAGRSGWNQAVALLVDPAVAPLARRHLVWIVDALAVDSAAEETVLLAQHFRAEDVRAQVIRAVGERRSKSAVAEVVAALADSSPVVRLQAIIALGRIGDPATVAPLLPILTDLDRTLAFSARQALRRIGAWDAVASALKASDSRTRAAILAALESVYDPGAVAALQGVLSDSTAPSDERARALTELALVARKAPEWDGKWWGTRPTQGKPPARTIDWAATPAILAVIEAGLNDPAPLVRRAAVVALVETRNKPALGSLRRRFEPGIEPDLAVRAEVAGALGMLGDKAAIPSLVLALEDQTTPGPIRDAALGALQAIGGAEATRPLVDLLRNRGTALAEPVAIQLITALGRSGEKAAVPDLTSLLSGPSALIRAACAVALGEIGPASVVAPAIRAKLSDPIPTVRKAALAALGHLGDHVAVPAMIGLAIDEATRFEAMLALAEVADIRALGVYLQGLTDKSPAIRQASLRAMVAIRDEAAPALDRLAARRELSPSAIPELRKVYSQFGPIHAWNLLGPVPLDAAAPVAPGSAIDLAATVTSSDGIALGWKPARGDAEHGTIDLIRLLPQPTHKRAIFAVAEVESPTARGARMMVGCDDTLDVWLNGNLVHQIGGNHSYGPDMAEFAVTLKAGKNQVFVRNGNDGGDWKFSVAVTQAVDYGFLQGPAPGGFDPDQHRAVALKGGGKADHGKTLFSDLKGLACTKCHAVDGQGGAIGPNLSGIAAMYPRAELINSVLAPSSRIFSGYETVVVATRDGRVVSGLLKSDNADGLELEDADGKRTRIAPSEVEERKLSDLSLMPNGIVEGISPNDFADLIAYLETLKNGAANQGKPGGQ